MKQKQLRTFGDVKRELKTLPHYMIKVLKTRKDAFNLMINQSGMSDEYISSYCGVDKGHFSRMKTGQANFPSDGRLEKIIEVCGNLALLQYDAFALGLPIFEESKQEKIDKLKAELSDLEAA